jgi:hypothetical protein
VQVRRNRQSEHNPMNKSLFPVGHEIPFDLEGGTPPADPAAWYSLHIITADSNLSGMTQVASFEHELHNPLSSSRAFFIFVGKLHASLIHKCDVYSPIFSCNLSAKEVPALKCHPR